MIVEGRPVSHGLTQAKTTLSDDASTEQRTLSLARRIIDLARGLIVADNPFLSASVGLINPQPAAMDDCYATDGKTLYLNPELLIARFAEQRVAPVHDVLHLLFHGLLLHPFVGASIDGDAWNLAADITAESLAAEVAGLREGSRGVQMQKVFGRLLRDVGGPVTTERLYRMLCDGAYGEQRTSWAELFYVDSHRLWAAAATPQSASSRNAGTGSAENERQSARVKSSKARVENLDANQRDAGTEQTGDSQQSTRAKSSQAEAESTGDAQQSTSSESSQAGADERQSEETPTHAPVAEDDNNGVQNEKAAYRKGASPPPPPLTPAQRKAAEDAWNRAAQSMRVDLETLSRTRGEGLSGLKRQLEVGAHKRMDYREFLRQFAVEREHMRVSDDEFDYIFYTYGLDLYGNVPLVEPLEYKSEKRIRDFVIVIDTSSSVSAKVVQEFVNTTFDVLTSEGGFFAQTNIHIIQADARVQSDVAIRSLADLDRWRRNINLYGFGGTDFRPAFRYVQELRQAGEFEDLQGLIYFTDGWGIYPDRMPPYPCAFVFYDEDHRPELVPPWAIQLVLHPGAFESLSVY